MTDLWTDGYRLVVAGGTSDISTLLGEDIVLARDNPEWKAADMFGAGAKDVIATLARAKADPLYQKVDAIAAEVEKATDVEIKDPPESLPTSLWTSIPEDQFVIFDEGEKYPKAIQVKDILANAKSGVLATRTEGKDFVRV